MESERALQTISARGLDRSSLPMRLFEKAKVRGIWNPSEIDFAQDRSDWTGLAADEQDLLLRLTTLFLGGEESVARDLVPLIATVAAEGRLEEELYLATFLFEEAKHVDLFRRFLDEVAGVSTDLSHYQGPSYRQLICEELPRSLARLHRDRSPEAQAEASVTYNLVVEGILAETGYHGYFSALDRGGILPGMRTGVSRLQEDESRHIAYGVHLLSRLLLEHGDAVRAAIERRFSELVPLALGVVQEIFQPYSAVPFGLLPRDFLDFALTQSSRRIERLQRTAARLAPVDSEEADG